MDFLTIHNNRPRGRNANADLRAPNIQDSDFHIATDEKGFPRASGQN